MTFTPIVVGSGLGAYALLNQTRDRQQSAFNDSPQIARDTAYFSENIARIQTSDDLVGDRTLLRVALGAFGLDGDIDNRVFIKQVLESDLSDPASLANRLSDTRYQGLAEAFGFNSPNGPQLTGASSLGARLDAVETADDLLSNRSLLREALARFGLEADERNTFFLQRVLSSDVTDPTSFVNELGQPKYIDLAAAFDFANRDAPETGVAGFVQAFSGRFDEFATADELLADKTATAAAVALFGLENDNPVLLKQVLNADPTDENSLVNQKADKRYLAFSEAFRFGWPSIDDLTTEQFLANDILRADALDQFDVSDPGDERLRELLNSDLGDPASAANQPENAAYLDFVTAFQTGWPETPSPAETFVDALSGKLDSLTTAAAIVFDLDVFSATLDMFGQQDRATDFLFLQKILDSDLFSTTSYAALHPDKRLGAMAQAFAINPGDVGRAYPEGFAADITTLYTTRQFEIGVGEIDADMRLALSLERELNTIIDGGGTEDTMWFGILGSPPLRQVFETTFRLPSGFVNLDLDQQLAEIKTRADRVFGASDVTAFRDPEVLDDLRNRFLLGSTLNATLSTTSSGSAALALLQGG